MGREVYCSHSSSEGLFLIFTPTKLKGAYLIDPEKLEDERGFFARSFCRDDFKERGLASEFVQSSFSFNAKKGTLRGMHYQKAPHEECKLIRCTVGSIYDVIIDLRPSSLTFTQYFGTVLSARNYRMLYVPSGMAHGFLTLEDRSEVFYQISKIFHPQSAEGVRWNDPHFALTWPAEVCVISKRDQAYPDFSQK